MSDILSALSDNFIQILVTVITAVLSYIGLQIKKNYQEYMQYRSKKEIVEKTVAYVEQTSKDLSCELKKQKATEKALEWIKEKKLSISDTELDILIESAVNNLQKRD